jgi:protein-arginine kinase
MYIYHVWADKTNGITDQEWVENLHGFLEQLVQEDHMVRHRITRCKVGFCSIADMPEWHVMMEFRDQTQLEATLNRVMSLDDELEAKHKSFNQFVGSNTQYALSRDWLDH